MCIRDRNLPPLPQENTRKVAEEGVEAAVAAAVEAEAGAVAGAETEADDGVAAMKTKGRRGKHSSKSIFQNMTVRSVGVIIRYKKL